MSGEVGCALWASGSRLSGRHQRSNDATRLSINVHLLHLANLRTPNNKTSSSPSFPSTILVLFFLSSSLRVSALLSNLEPIVVLSINPGQHRERERLYLSIQQSGFHHHHQHRLAHVVIQLRLFARPPARLSLFILAIEALYLRCLTLSSGCCSRFLPRTDTRNPFPADLGARPFRIRDNISTD